MNSEPLASNPSLPSRAGSPALPLSHDQPRHPSESTPIECDQRVPVRKRRCADQQVMRADHRASLRQLRPHIGVSSRFRKPERQHGDRIEQAVHERATARADRRVPRPQAAVEQLGSGNRRYRDRLVAQRLQEPCEVTGAAFGGNDDRGVEDYSHAARRGGSASRAASISVARACASCGVRWGSAAQRTANSRPVTRRAGPSGGAVGARYRATASRTIADLGRWRVLAHRVSARASSTGRRSVR